MFVDIMKLVCNNAELAHKMRGLWLCRFLQLLILGRCQICGLVANTALLYYKRICNIIQIIYAQILMYLITQLCFMHALLTSSNSLKVIKVDRNMSK
jgi:hypothetical protein